MAHVGRGWKLSPFLENLHRDISILGSWVFFGVRVFLWRTQPNQVAVEAGGPSCCIHCFRDQRWASMGGWHGWLRRPGWQANAPHSQIPQQASGLEQQCPRNCSMREAAQHGVAGGFWQPPGMSANTFHLCSLAVQWCMETASWLCLGNIGLGSRLLRLKSWDRGFKQCGKGHGISRNPCLLLANRWWL